MHNKALFPQSTADFLNISNKPPSDSDFKMQRFRGQEIFYAFGPENAFIYCENILHSDDFTPSVEPDSPESEMSVIINRLKNPLNASLVVSYIDKKRGYGLYTRQPIECGELVCIYGGQLPSRDRRVIIPDEFHRLGDIMPNHQKRMESNEYTNGPSEIDATLAGGIARFIQHAPLHKKALLAQIDQAPDLTTLELIAKSKGAKNSNLSADQLKRSLKKYTEQHLRHYYDDQIESFLRCAPWKAKGRGA